MIDPVCFEWDTWNIDKNRKKHGVEPHEAEEIFFNTPLMTGEARFVNESRFYALGHTDDGRSLFIVFTIRKDAIRVISARDMSRKERGVYYAKENKEM